MTNGKLEKGRPRLDAAGVVILENDDPAIEFEVSTSMGIVAIMANAVRVEDALILDRVHVTGQGLTISRIRQLARAFGEVEGAGEVIIQGGIRSSGARRGSSPTPIRVKVQR